MQPVSVALRLDVNDFLAAEYELLDERRFDEWLALLADDVRYWAPLARNLKHTELRSEYTKERSDAAWFDEDKHTLSQRVLQIQGGDHWAEEPASRTTHLVAGIRIASETDAGVTVKSRFAVYVNRGEREIQLFAGKRVDVLRRDGDSFLISHRSIFLDQNLMTAKSLTTFL